MDANLTRRRLLRLLVSCLGAIGVAPFVQGAQKLSAYRANEHIASQLTRVLVHRRSAAAVGREYLRIAPEEADADRLISLIFPYDKQSVASLLKAEPDALANWLQAKQRDDFDRSRVVLVQRWMLSKTEARLCALVALS